MTIISIHATAGTISLDQRRELATTLTDAVALVECGQIDPAARWGFQVHFLDLPADQIAIGGTLAADLPDIAPLTVDIAVMDGSWTPAERAQVIERTFAALRTALVVDVAPPTWWVTFRTIDEGSWGASGAPLSIIALLDLGVFTTERAACIRKALAT
ncbi:tautomerase family protein [Aquihabitans sp. McL0605]|uniref:tautomerase family protein n=1 Tax=Aquihabitans sp. McL0605 TaxID=3415671 RepID=UPI003CEA95DC